MIDLLIKEIMGNKSDISVLDLRRRLLSMLETIDCSVGAGMLTRYHLTLIAGINNNQIDEKEVDSVPCCITISQKPSFNKPNRFTGFLKSTETENEV